MMDYVFIRFQGGKMNKIWIEDPQWEEKAADSHHWRVYQRKRYPVKIQTADRNRIYNVPDSPGIVYNFLEDSYESLEHADYVITGLLGEMWPVTKKNIQGYEASEEEITDIPETFFSKASDARYYALQIPDNISFTVQTEKYGDLKGNVAGREHGNGDFLICTSFQKQDFRIVNGQIFDEMYEEDKRNVR